MQVVNFDSFSIALSRSGTFLSDTATVTEGDNASDSGN